MVEEKAEAMLEIIELESGDMAIRHIGEEEPLMTVSLSETMRDLMPDKTVDVARMMLTAGVQMLAEAGYDFEEPANTSREPEEVLPVLH